MEKSPLKNDGLEEVSGGFLFKFPPSLSPTFMVEVENDRKWLYLKGNYYWRQDNHFLLNHDYGRKEQFQGLSYVFEPQISPSPA